MGCDILMTGQAGRRVGEGWEYHGVHAAGGEALMDYEAWYVAAGMPSPYSYQRRLSAEAWPDILDVPTGMGKTAAVTLAWMWKRGWRAGEREAGADATTPRRLVWCLPMRVLVEQTEENVRGWLGKLGVLGRAGEGKVSVHVVMGGCEDTGWSSYPEEDEVLIGTQDMLLSRALMRGYGMSRYQWPMHFALLHNDCLWVFDEVQLMGAGLAASAQVEAFRRVLPLAKSSRSLWVSATMNRKWLATVDLKPHLGAMRTLGLDDEDRRQAAGRLNAAKGLERLPLALGKEAGNKAGLAAYLESLAAAVLRAHHEGSQTICIVNTVERAQGLFRLVSAQRPGKPDLLVHGRFRAAERTAQNCALRAAGADRIIIATQAIEAGVDISSRALITELAPWPSMVQRFGRCNRYGEHPAGAVYWVNIEDDKDALLPYAGDEVAEARQCLEGRASARAQDLPAVGDARPLTAVLRRKDLLELFNTDPDLSGFDVDVSDYIRGSGRPGVQVFWRAFGADPNQPEPQSRAARAELCPVSMSHGRDLFKRGAWYWDALGDKHGDGRWVRLDRPPRPGMMLLLEAAGGGYDQRLGFDAGSKAPVTPVGAGEGRAEAYGADWRSEQKLPVGLADHLGHVGGHASRLCEAVGETAHVVTLRRAGLWHDVGKAHPVFQATMHRCGAAPEGMLAKSPCGGRHERKFFRHELASALAWMRQHDGEPGADLIAYVIAAHHGKVRMSLRAMPTEEADAGVGRFARGIWEGDVLPALDFHGEHSGETPLSLGVMELGEGERGPSWTARTLKLLDEHGPFQLAWLETLLRVADWRASAEENELAMREGA